MRKTPWTKATALKPSSIAGGGTILFNAKGQCIGQVMVLNVKPEQRDEFEAAVTDALIAAAQCQGRSQ